MASHGSRINVPICNLLKYKLLFVHWDNVTVVAQPLVNHRALSIQNIKSKDFRRKMQQEGSDFAEEMHAVIYELRNKDNGENLSSVPIYSTYVINPDQSIEHELTDVEAVYPTVQGLKNCINKKTAFLPHTLILLSL